MKVISSLAPTLMMIQSFSCRASQLPDKKYRKNQIHLGVLLNHSRGEKDHSLHCTLKFDMLSVANASFDYVGSNKDGTVS